MLCGHAFYNFGLFVFARCSHIRKSMGNVCLSDAHIILTVNHEMGELPSYILEHLNSIKVILATFN